MAETAALIAASTIGQGAMMGAAIGGGIPLLTGGNMKRVLMGAVGGGFTGGVGAGIPALAGGSSLAEALGVGNAAAGTTAAATATPAQVAGQLGVQGASVAPNSLSSLLSNQVAGDPDFQATAFKQLREAAQDALPSNVAASSSITPTGAAIKQAALPSFPGASLLDNPIKYGAEHLKTAMAAGVMGLNAAQPRPQIPGQEQYTSRYKWPNNNYVFNAASGGVASLAPYGYDRVVGEQAMYPRTFASGGVSDLGTYSDGGRMLRGPGDGMSDSIPGVIGSKRPARLADGEFVVPADVVSHLGNGSTDAGAKQLYAMMDKVRRARTGTNRQGREINPRRFLPA